MVALQLPRTERLRRYLVSVSDREVMVEALARILQIDTDVAAALLAAGDGNPETAIAIHVGYNDGVLPDGVDLAALSLVEGERRARADDPEALRAAAADEPWPMRLVGL